MLQPDVCWKIGDRRWALLTDRSPREVKGQPLMATYHYPNGKTRFQYVLTRKPRGSEPAGLIDLDESPKARKNDLLKARNS